MPTQELTKPIDTDNNSPELEKQYESIVAVLLERQQNGYRRGIDNDGRKVGLTFDMGALAGVVSLAVARKLQTAGLLDYVDGFYGLSSGGVNAAFTATGQAKQGIDVYMNLMPQDKLVQLYPPRSPVMDLDVLRRAITEKHQLDLKKITGKNGIPVVIGVTAMDSPFQRNKVYKSTEADPEHPEEFIDQLMRGCNYPILAGGPMEGEEGERYTDGGMAWESAMELAMQDGCTHILSLANAPPTNTESSSIGRKALNGLITSVGERYINVHGTRRPRVFSLKEQVFNPVGTYIDRLISTISGDLTDYSHHDYSKIVKRRAEAPYPFSESFYEYKGARVERIYPPNMEGLPQMLTSEKKVFQKGIRAGRLAIRKSLEES